jgi:hypothetical protein
MNLQATIAKLLASKRDSLTSPECHKQIAAIGARLEEIRARLAAIDREPAASGKLSSERKRIAESGAPEELLELDREQDLLEAEDLSLCTQREALRERMQKATIEEAPGRVKAALKRLGPALQAAETAAAARAKAIAELSALQVEISAQRRIAKDGGIDAPAVSDADFERLAVSLNWNYEEKHIVFKENVDSTRRLRRMELTAWRPKQPAEPSETPWQTHERLRRAEEQELRGGYLKSPSPSGGPRSGPEGR